MKLNITELFVHPSVKDLAIKELEQNQRALLSHQSSAMYYKKLVEYCEENIKRLRSYINKPEEI
jgi:hypothetical protein